MAGRGKVILQRITNENKRKACQKKRMAGLLKKAHEVSTLCDVESATIVYCPGEKEPTVWPPSYENVKETVEKFLGKPEVERRKYSVTHEGFLAEKVKKKQAKFNQMKKKNDDMEFQTLLASLTHHHHKEMNYRELDSTQSNAVVTFGDAMKEKLKEKLQKLEDLRRTPPPPTSVGQMRERKGNSTETLWLPPSAGSQPPVASQPAVGFPPVAGHFSAQQMITYGFPSADDHFPSKSGFH